MNFKDLFSQSVSTKMMANTECSPKILIPNCYQCNDTLLDNIDDLLHITAGGRISTNQLFSFTFKPMNTYLVLYTAEGGGRISCHGNAYHIPDKSLVLVDCHHEFSLQSLILPWNFKLFFFDGSITEMYKRAFLPYTNTPVHIIEEFSPSINAIDQLMRLPVQYNEKSALIMHQALTTILTSSSIFYYDDIQTISPDVPSYLIDLKDIFDNHYEEQFSLSVYEDTFNISKYRICKDFSNHFGISPLLYLNNKRIDVAKEMLLTTDYNVYEISSIVGIDNVNHFINLFKKNTGVTPKVFRQQIRAQQFA